MMLSFELELGNTKAHLNATFFDLAQMILLGHCSQSVPIYLSLGCHSSTSCSSQLTSCLYD